MEGKIKTCKNCAYCYGYSAVFKDTLVCKNGYIKEKDILNTCKDYTNKNLTLDRIVGLI